MKYLIVASPLLLLWVLIVVVVSIRAVRLFKRQPHCPDCGDKLRFSTVLLIVWKVAISPITMARSVWVVWTLLPRCGKAYLKIDNDEPLSKSDLKALRDLWDRLNQSQVEKDAFYEAAMTVRAKTQGFARAKIDKRLRRIEEYFMVFEAEAKEVACH